MNKEQLSADSNQMLQLVLDTIPARVFWKDRDSVFLGCNRLFATDAGYSSPDELIGKTDYDVPWRDQADMYVSDDRKVMETGIPKLNYEEPQTTPDGRCIWLRTSKIPLKDEEGRVIGVLGAYEDITERKNAEEQLRRSEEKYRELVQNANSIILRWGRDGTVRFFNEFAQNFFGYTEEEIVGRNVIGTIVPETETSGRDLRTLISHILADPERYETSVNENVKRNGERVWIAWTNKLVHSEQTGTPEILSVGLDITARKHAEDALQESEERYRSIFNSNVDAFLLFDTDGNILDANARAAELYGYSRTELTGLSGRDIVDPRFYHTFQDFARTAVGEWFDAESCDIRKDGTRFDVEVHGTRLRYGGKERLLAIIFDITKQKQADQDKRRFYRKTIEAATEGKLIICDRNEIARFAGDPIAEYKIPRPEGIGEARDTVARIAESEGMDQARLFDLVLCAGEAATNAIKHAQGGTLSVHKRNGALLVVVSDHGPGMQEINLPDVALKRGYTTAVSLGMGYKAMISIADHVYLATGPDGTTVAVEMRLRPAPKPLVVPTLPDTW